MFVLAAASEVNLASVKEIAREEIQATTPSILGTPVGEAYWDTTSEKILPRLRKTRTLQENY